VKSIHPLVSLLKSAALQSVVLSHSLVQATAVVAEAEVPPARLVLSRVSYLSSQVPPLEGTTSLVLVLVDGGPITALGPKIFLIIDPVMLGPGTEGGGGGAGVGAGVVGGGGVGELNGDLKYVSQQVSSTTGSALEA
jgi:hypothetical protein